jgi:hypothetical protein
LAGITCSASELDRYLWLSGVYRAYLSGEKRINSEARRLFERAEGESSIALDLSILLGEAIK